MTRESDVEPIGRPSEMRALQEFLDDVPERGGSIVVSGEAGIGKSLLFGEASREAAARGFRVLVSRPAPPDASLSFSGLSDLLRNVVDEVLPTLPDPQRRALEVALLIRDADGQAPGSLAVALALQGALAALAGSRPLVVAVDDAEWLDGPSIGALGHALRRLETTLIGVLVVWPSPSWQASDSPLLAALEPAARRLTVGPLPVEDLRVLLLDRLDLSLSGSRLAHLHRACGGNPLAALEIGRIVAENVGAEVTDLAVPVPGHVADLLRSRLAKLGPDAQESLLVLSIVSEPTRPLLEAVVGGDRAGALSAAVHEQVVVEEAGRLRFTHPLFGSVVYADAAAGQRRELHGRVANLVADEVERALHLALSMDGTDADVASEVEAAARTLRGRAAPSAAAEMCERAAALTPTDAGDDSIRRRLLAAEYHLDAGELTQSRTLLESVLESTTSGSQRGAALQRLGWVRYHKDSWATASELFRDAAETSREPAFLMTLELDQAVAGLISGDVIGAALHAEAAVEQAKAVDDPALVAEASALEASVEFLHGRGMDDSVMRQAIRDERWTMPRPTPGRPSVAYGVLLKWSDEFGESRSLLERAEHQAREHGSTRSLPFILFHLAEVECWLGDWAAARQHAETARELTEKTGQDSGRAFALSAHALILAHMGRETEARTSATEGLALANSSGTVPAAVCIESTLGFLELSLQRADRAMRHFGPLLDPLETVGVNEPGAVRYLGDALESLIAVGDLERAEILIERLHARAEKLGRVWGLVVSSRSRALAAAASGDLAGSVTFIDAAMSYHDDLGQPFELGRTLLVRGTIQRRNRSRRAARESLERSLEVFQGLGADIWASRVQAELGRISGRAQSPLALTGTEQRIAALAGGGATNNEIAAQLFLSVRTVEWNLSRIFRKLGVRSRTELARWVAFQGETVRESSTVE